MLRDSSNHPLLQPYPIQTFCSTRHSGIIPILACHVRSRLRAKDREENGLTQKEGEGTKAS